MKALFILPVIGLVALVRSDAELAPKDLEMLCCPPLPKDAEDDMRHPLAYIKHDSSLLSLALPGNVSDVDAFLTEVYGANSLIWYTFPQRKRLGVDTNGKLEFDYENRTTFRRLNPCRQDAIKSLYYPYTLLCATRNEGRNERNFLVSMNGVKGFRVDNCNDYSLSSTKFCKNANSSTALWKNYLFHQMSYREDKYLAWKKCLPYTRSGKQCPKTPLSSVRPERCSITVSRIEGTCSASQEKKEEISMYLCRGTSKSVWEVEEANSKFRPVLQCKGDTTGEFCQSKEGVGAKLKHRFTTSSATSRKFKCKCGNLSSVVLRLSQN